MERKSYWSMLVKNGPRERSPKIEVDYFYRTDQIERVYFYGTGEYQIRCNFIDDFVAI